MPGRAPLKPAAAMPPSGRSSTAPTWRRQQVPRRPSSRAMLRKTSSLSWARPVMGSDAAGLDLRPVSETGLEVVAVHEGDVLELDALGAGGLALAMVGAAAELFLVHLGDHVAHADHSLGLALGQVGEVADLCGDE